MDSWAFIQSLSTTTASLLRFRVVRISFKICASYAEKHSSALAEKQLHNFTSPRGYTNIVDNIPLARHTAGGQGGTHLWVLQPKLLHNHPCRRAHSTRFDVVETAGLGISK
jgi:hypothetical protein